MELCRDDATSYLRRLGYHVVLHPRTDIRVMDVLVGMRPSRRLGRLSDVWASDAELPSVEQASATDVTVTQTGAIRASLGIALLEQLLSGVSATAGVPTAARHVTSARSMRFSFPNPEVTTVSLAKLDPFLSTGDFRVRGPFVSAYADFPGARIRVVVETLAARRLDVAFEGRSQSSLELEVSAAASALSGGLESSLAVSKASGTVLSFESSVPVVFGFKSAALVFNHGAWSLPRREDLPGAIYMGGSGEESPLPDWCEFVDLDERRS